MMDILKKYAIPFGSGFILGGFCGYYFFKKNGNSVDNGVKNLNEEKDKKETLRKLTEEYQKIQKDRINSMFFGTGGQYVNLNTLSSSYEEKALKIKNDILDQFKNIKGMTVDEGRSYVSQFGYGFLVKGEEKKYFPRCYETKGEVAVYVVENRIVDTDFIF